MFFWGTLEKIEEEKKVEEEEECIENEELEENLMDKIKDTVQKMTDGRNSSSKEAHCKTIVIYANSKINY